MDKQILNAIKNLEQRVVDLYSKLKNINPISSTGDLQGVTTEGNTTTNSIELLDTAKVTFDNGSRLQKGTTNSYNGGNGGIAQVCSIDYELKWEAGRQYVMQQDGFTIREVNHTFTLTPGVNDDSTRGFVPDSRWILDNGDIYLCTDNTEGVAVWELISTTIPKYKVFTALVTQKGDDGTAQGISDSPLIVGATYYIVDNGGSGWDFTNVGAPNNDLLTYFVATGTTPTSWGIDGQLGYTPGAPEVIVLENTIGNIWFTYHDVGTYKCVSDSLFTEYTTTISLDAYCQNGNAGALITNTTINNDVEFTIFTFKGNFVDDLLQKNRIEIRVYN